MATEPQGTQPAYIVTGKVPRSDRWHFAASTPGHVTTDAAQVMVWRSKAAADQAAQALANLTLRRWYVTREDEA